MARMNRKVQIVISSKPNGTPGAAWPADFRQRLKAALIAFGVASIGLGVLILLLILGSMVAVVLWILLILLVAVAILRAALRRFKQAPVDRSSRQ
jgi:hypothetical protein